MKSSPSTQSSFGLKLRNLRETLGAKIEKTREVLEIQILCFFNIQN